MSEQEQVCLQAGIMIEEGARRELGVGSQPAVEEGASSELGEVD